MTSPSKFSVTTGPLPASQKVYVAGRHFPDLRVAMRETALSTDEPAVRIYDPSGPYTDPAANINIRKGLPCIRQAWIEARGDVETYEGRKLRPEDNGAQRIGKPDFEVFPGAIAARFARRRGNA